MPNRYGAAYFEQQWVDYDEAANWEYLAGVGADPLSKRHFDFEKQIQQYEPDELFINKWQGGIQNLQLNSVEVGY